MWRKKAKMGIVLVAVLFLVSVLPAFASGEGWEGELSIKLQSGLGDAKDEIQAGLDDHDISLITGTEKTAVSVDECVIDLGEGCHSVLEILMNLPEEMPALSRELEDKAAFSTADIKAESNIYNSLFTESKFSKLSAEDTVNILSSRAFREIMSGIADWDEFAESTEGADDFDGSITFFQVEEKYLMVLDFTACGKDYLVSAEYDGFSFTVSAFADTNVTDWDDSKEAITAGNSENGLGIKVFAMIFDDKTESENYVEIAKYTGGNNNRLELSNYQSAGDNESKDIEISAVRNDKKCIKLKATLETGETDLSSAVSVETAAGSIESSTYQSVIKCLQVICGE